MQAYELIPSPSERGFIQVVKEARKSLFIAAPYIKDYGTKLILSNARVDSLQMLTNLNIANVTGTGFDIDALLSLWARFDVQVSSLGKLHAKTYIADSRIAFVTSANLTRGGLVENYEYRLVLRDGQLVSAMLDDMKKYFALGNIFSREKIEGIRADVTQIRNLQEALAKSDEVKHLCKVLRQKEDALQTRLLENRVEGKSLNAIFAETIRYLLGSRGPLSTRELNPLVQDIHPDICDDSIDRVIRGQHFGKKWKHLVRHAQQYLKGAGMIYLQEGKWHLKD
jgi:hypothetical protein